MRNVLFSFYLIFIFIPLIFSQCNAGQYNSNGNCINCPAGTFSQSSGLGIGSCLLCPAGRFQNIPGSINCTSCSNTTSTVFCPAGSPSQMSTTSLTTTLTNPSDPVSAQNAKIGFVFVALLLFLIPLLVTLVSCYNYTVFGTFDFVFAESHLIKNGEVRVKKKAALGGFCTFLAISLFLMCAGAIIVDFYWENVTRVGKLQPSTELGRTYPFGLYNYNARVVLNGVSPIDCVATTSTVGYIQNQINSLKTTCISTFNTTCTCDILCTNCSISQTQSMTVNFPSERVFATSLNYMYSVQNFGGSMYTINGTVLPPSNQVFFGSTPTTLGFTLFYSVLNGLIGGRNGGAQWTQWADTFVANIRYTENALSFQLETITKGSSSGNLTSSTGLSIMFSGAMSNFVYTVDEVLLQTVWSHFAELVSVFVFWMILCYVLMQILELFLQKYNDLVDKGVISRITKDILRPYKIVKRLVLNLFKKPSDKVNVMVDTESEKDDDEKKEKLETDEPENDVERLTHKIQDLEDKIKKHLELQDVDIEKTLERPKSVLKVEPVHVVLDVKVEEVTEKTENLIDVSDPQVLKTESLIDVSDPQVKKE